MDIFEYANRVEFVVVTISSPVSDVIQIYAPLLGAKENWADLLSK